MSLSSPHWRTLVTVLLFFGALASGWSIWKHTHQTTDEVLRARPDYVLRNYEITSLNTQGSEAFTLRGPVLQRDPNDRTLALQAPHFSVPDSLGRYWEVQAARGTVPAEGGKIQLDGGVQATSPPDTPPTQIHTERLTLLLNDHGASTASQVTITRPGLTMQGVGMRANFDRQQVSLLSQVRTRYVPQP